MKWLKDKIEDLQGFWDDKMGTLRSWIDNLQRIWDWLPILLQDYDFDSRPGIYRVMRKKLERLEPCLRYGHHVYGARDANQVKVAIKVLDRIIADEYDEEEQAPVDKKWGKPKFSFKPIGSGMSQMVTKRRKATTPQQIAQADAEYMQAIHRAEAREIRDITWVFAFIAKWHRHWWD